MFKWVLLCSLILCGVFMGGCSNTIGPEGGSVTFGSWTIVFPPGALDRTTMITGVPARDFPSNDGIIGEPYVFGPARLNLAGKGVQIFSTYDPAQLGKTAVGDLVLAVADTGWTVLPSSLPSTNPETYSVGASIDQLSTIALVSGVAANLAVPPMIRNLTVSDSALPIGVAVPVTLTWDYAFTPSSAVTCTLGGAPVTSGVPIDLTRTEDGTFTLVCENAAGSDSQTITFAVSEAPVLKSFVAAPPEVLIGVPTPVTFSWSYEGDPAPGPVCTIAGIGEVANGETIEVTISLPSQTYELTCENNAGTDTKSVAVYGMLPMSIPASLGTSAIDLPLGSTGMSLSVPENALVDPVNFNIAFDTGLPSNPNQIGLAVTFDPPVWFQNPVTLTLPYYEAYLSMFGPDVAEILKNVGVATLDENGEWMPLHTEIDPVAQTLTVEINMLTSFAVVANALTNSLGVDMTKAEWSAKAAHPLRFQTSRLANVAELALGMPTALPSAGGRNALRVYDHDTKQTPTDADKKVIFDSTYDYSNVEERLWGSVSGDFDDDGLDEIAVLGSKWDRNTSDGYAVWYLKMTVCDDAKHNYAILASWSSKDNNPGSSPVTASSSYSYYDADLDVVRLKDFNGVSREFLLITGSFGRMNTSHVPVYMENNNAWIIDMKGGLKKPWSMWRAMYTADITYETRAAAGDVDGSGQDVVFWVNQGNQSGNLTVVAGFDFKWADANTLTRSGSTKFSPYYKGCGTVNRPSIACGDFNGDYNDELALFGHGYGNDAFWLEIWKPKSNGWENLNRKDSPNSGWGDGTPIMLAADVDNDHCDELIFNVFGKGGGGPSYRSALWWWDVNNNLLDQVHWNWMDYASMAMGNTDTDEFAELQIVYQNPDNSNQYVFRQYNHDKGSWAKAYEKTFARSGSSYRMPWIVAGDFDGDSTVVKYRNEWKYDKSNILPIAALTYPPFWNSATMQDTGSCDASIRFGTTASSDTSKSLGITAGASVSVEGGDPFGIVTAEASVSFEMEFSKTKTKSKSTGSAVTFTANQGENAVVEQSTYWDHYRYTVLASRIADQVGKTVTIDVPRGSPIMSIDKASVFNSTNGSYPDFDSRIFDNTVGCPKSYPTAAGSGDWTSDQVGIGTGGTVTLELSQSEGTTNVTEKTWAVTMEAGMSVGGVGFAASVGVTGGDSYSFTMAKDTTYTGSMGAVLDGQYQYTAGMIVKTMQHPDKPGVKFQLIDFLAKDYGGVTCP